MQKYRRLFQYARRQRGFLAVVALLTVAASALAALQPWPLKWLVDYVLEQRPLPGWFRHVFDAVSLEPTAPVLLAIAVLGGLVLFALNTLLELRAAWAWTITGRRIVYDLAEELFARLQRRSLRYHSQHTVGDAMSRVTTDSWAVYHVLDTLLVAPGHAALTIVVMLALMAPLDPTLTLVSVVTAPLMVAASLLVGKPLRAAARLRRDLETRIQAHLQQTLTGIPVVQAFVQEEREHARFQAYADAAIAAQQRSTLVGSLNSLSSGLVTTLGTGVVLWLGARHVMAGTLSIGSLLAFLFWFNLLQAQMKVFANLYTTLLGVSASVDRVSEVLDATPEITDQPGAPALPKVTGHVRFENVTAGYETGRPVLRGLQLDVPAGCTLAIVGPTGAGKSTLVNLIPRFLDPWEGCVLVDGRDTREVQLRSLRAQVALVAQEPMLFPVSVAENLAFGRPTATRAEIEAAARAAHAHEFITRLPAGYDTVLGERGATLSGGERQRLAIARALVKNAPILILDEPTSAVDAETERLVLEALERLIAGRTTFLIAHRLSTVRRADRIIVLEAGKIVEDGTHDALLARDGAYAALHRRQFGGTQSAVPLPG